jgi:galactose mutarotase-like enzyme
MGIAIPYIEGYLMLQKTDYKGWEIFTIYADDGISQASFVPAKGGVISSLIMSFQGVGRETLFQHEYFCDKIFGNYLYDGHIYNLPIHGFASQMPWHCEILAKNSLRLTLTDNAATLAQYPFSFKIELEYKITGGRLTCKQTYSNTGKTDMPYYAGFHPYFLTPGAGSGKQNVLLDYAPQRRFVYNERMTDLIGEQELFPVPASVADPQINEQLTKLGKNKVVTLAYPEGFKINMEAMGESDPNMFSYIQLYTQVDKPFICVEPWMSFPNGLNTVFGARCLRPGQSEQGILKVWI